jgi:hypothetical protein
LRSSLIENTAVWQTADKPVRALVLSERGLRERSEDEWTK